MNKNSLPALAIYYFFGAPQRFTFILCDLFQVYFPPNFLPIWKVHSQHMPYVSLSLLTPLLEVANSSVFLLLHMVLTAASVLLSERSYTETVKCSGGSHYCPEDPTTPVQVFDQPAGVTGAVARKESLTDFPPWM